MERFITFVNSPRGRWTRIALGCSLCMSALRQRRTVTGLVGAQALAAGIFDFSLLNKLGGYPLRGPEARTLLGEPPAAPLFGGKKELVASEAAASSPLQ